MHENPTSNDSSTAVATFKKPTEKDLFTDNFVISSWNRGENPSQDEIDAAWEVEAERLREEKREAEEAMKPRVVWSKGNPAAANVVYRRVTGEEPVGRFPVVREEAKPPRR